MAYEWAAYRRIGQLHRLIGLRKPECEAIATPVYATMAKMHWGRRADARRPREWPGMATTPSAVSMFRRADGLLPLTVEERRVLSLSARGLSATDAAEVMGTSVPVVRVWPDLAFDKLGVCSKLEAIIVAARRGELDLPR